jgi:hypothetical protein
MQRELIPTPRKIALGLFAELMQLYFDYGTDSFRTLLIPGRSLVKLSCMFDYKWEGFSDYSKIVYR